MKNVSKQIFFIALVAVMGLAFAAPVQAGGIMDRLFNGGAKSLAKQAVNLIKQAAALQEKALVIEEKVSALSDKDRRAYQAELERLGFEPPEWLFNDAEALLTGAPEAPEGPGGILGFLAGIFGGGNRSRSGNTTTTAPPAETATAPPSTAPATTPAPASGGETGSGTEDDPFALTAGIWKDGSVPTNGSEVWYSFSVTSGTMYHVWWNEKGSGGDGTKTGNVVLFAKYSGETSAIFVFEDSGWSTPKSFIASTSGTVKIIVMEWGGPGTFAIAYSIDPPARPGSGGGSYTQGWPPNNVLSEFGIDGLTMPPGTTAAKWFQMSYKSEKGLVIQATTTTVFSHFEDYFTSNNWTKTMEQTSHPTLTQKKWGKSSVEAECSKNSSDNQLALTVKFR